MICELVYLPQINCNTTFINFSLMIIRVRASFLFVHVTRWIQLWHLAFGVDMHSHMTCEDIIWLIYLRFSKVFLPEIIDNRQQKLPKKFQNWPKKLDIQFSFLFCKIITNTEILDDFIHIFWRFYVLWMKFKATNFNVESDIEIMSPDAKICFSWKSVLAPCTKVILNFL